MTWKRAFQPGDPVVYRATKFSDSPGPRAENITAAEHGENYSYQVDKFWTVEEVLDDGRLRLRTRRGKEHVLAEDDPRLRRANLWERLVYKKRFPKPAV